MTCALDVTLKINVTVPCYLICTSVSQMLVNEFDMTELLVYEYKERRVSQDSIVGEIEDENDDNLLSTAKGSLNVRLYHAIQANNTDEAILLLKNKASSTFIHPLNKSRWSMLHWAAYHGNQTLVDCLLAENAALEYKSYRLKEIAFNRENNLNSNPANVNVNTPLHRAAQQGHLEVCWILVLSSFSHKDIDESGNTPLHLAASNGHKRVVKFLIDIGADTSAQNIFHNTPYDVALKSCQIIIKEVIPVQRVLSDGDREVMLHKTIERYVEAGTKIMRVIESEQWENRVVLQQAIDQAKNIGVASSTIEHGKKFLERVDLILTLESQINLVTLAEPVTTQKEYEKVIALENIMKEAESYQTTQKKMASSNKFSSFLASTVSFDVQFDSLPRDEIIPGLITKANSICVKSFHEYWLNRCLIKLQVVKQANDITPKELAGFEEAIERALSGGANAMLVADASRLHAKLTSEFELNRLIDEFPKIKNFEEGNEGSLDFGPEYRGHIHEHDGYPVLPENSEYEWKECKALSDHKIMISKLEKAVQNAEEVEACNELIFKVHSFVDKQKDLQDSFILKDALDKEAAIVVAQKAAKKLKKGKKRTNKAKF